MSRPGAWDQAWAALRREDAPARMRTGRRSRPSSGPVVCPCSPARAARTSAGPSTTASSGDRRSWAWTILAG